MSDPEPDIEPLRTMLAAIAEPRISGPLPREGKTGAQKRELLRRMLAFIDDPAFDEEPPCPK